MPERRSFDRNGLSFLPILRGSVNLRIDGRPEALEDFDPRRSEVRKHFLRRCESPQYVGELGADPLAGFTNRLCVSACARCLLY
jgi:hypothetical protein